MAVTSGSVLEVQVAYQEEEKHRSNCPEVREIGGRINDSENGKTCHQCRQTRRNFTVSCSNQKRGKQCTIKFCHKCLLNRYGEKAEEVALMDGWKCPKCKDICNCSCCMKKKGHKPTGMLLRAAKENGFSCVSEMLQIKGLENLGHDNIAKDTGVLPKKPVSSKEMMVCSPRKPGKENSFDVNSELNLHSQNLTPISYEKKSKITKGQGLKVVSNDKKDTDSRFGESGKEKPRNTDVVSKDEVESNIKDESVCVEKKKSKPQSKDVPEDELKKNEKYAGAFVGKKKSNVQFEELSEDEIKTNGKDEGVFVKEKKSKKESQEILKKSPEVSNAAKSTVEQDKQIEADVKLPQGTHLTTVAGIELHPEDVGHALQFLEFCSGFAVFAMQQPCCDLENLLQEEVLDLKKGQAEAVIREIINGQRLRQSKYRSHYSLVVQIHVQLLSLIHKDMGKEYKSPALTPSNGQNSWLQAVGKCVSKCRFMSKGFPSDCFGRGNEGYGRLNISEKLKLLNFLCDEALNTKDLRSWIDDQNSIFIKRVKEAKEKFLAAKIKEKHLKQKMEDEMANAIITKSGSSQSVAEHETLFSQVQNEAEQAHVEMLEATGMLQKKRERSDAFRTDPIVLDANGRAFWRLNCYNDQQDILLQDMGSWNSVALNEKWFVYSTEQIQEIEKYVSSLRMKRLRVQRVMENLPIGSIETRL